MRYKTDSTYVDLLYQTVTLSEGSKMTVAPMFVMLKCLVILTVTSPNVANVTTSEGWIIQEAFVTLPAEVIGPPNVTASEVTDILPSTDMPVLFTEIALIEHLHIVHCPTCLPPFAGGDKFYHSVTIWTSLACGSSVCNDTYKQAACGPFECEECHCDSDCSLYEDCCPDTYITTPRQEPLTNISCISQAFIPLAEPESISYKMISGCPGAAVKTNDEQSYRYKCHSPDPNDLRANVPVYSPSTKLDYKNRYCALCHGVYDVIYWGIKPFCISPLSLAHVSSRQDLMKVMRKDDTCAVYFTLPDQHTGRECEYEGQLINTCNTTGQWLNFNSDIEEACSLFVHPVTYEIDEQVTYYQNIFCASCNGVELSHANQCRHGLGKPSVAPFSLLLDIHEEEQMVMDDIRVHVAIPIAQCGTKEIYLSLTASCRPLFCPFGKFAEDHTCVSFLPSAKGLAYIMHLGYLPRDTDHIVVEDLQYFVQKLTGHIQLIVSETAPLYSVINTEVTFTQLNGSLTTYVHSVDVQFSIIVGAHIPRDQAETLLVSVLQSTWWWYEGDYMSPAYLDVFRLPAVSDGRHAAQPQNFFFTPDGPFGVIRNATFVFHDVRSFDPIPDRYIHNTSEFIEVHELLLCNMITLDPTDYDILQNGSIIIKFSESILTTQNYMLYNNTVYICADKSYTEKPNRDIWSEEVDIEELAEIWLTIICISLSLLGLALTIGLYIFRRRMSSLPGKNSLFLFVNIFLAQLMYLSGSSAKVDQPACRALGIIIHYFWLSSFCWKLICAFHMYWLLANPLKSFHQTKSFVKYVVFAHFTPLVVIALILALNVGISDLKQIGYGERRIGKDQYFCFLSSPIDLGVGFLLPLAITITINLYFFCRIVYSMSNRQQIQLHSSKSKMKESKVYLKMSFLFGFTWILGFIGAVVDLRGLWFLSTLLNASTGVFIFLSFGVSNIQLKYLSRGQGDSSTEPGTAMGTPRTPRINARLNLESVNSSPADSPAQQRKDNTQA